MRTYEALGKLRKPSAGQKCWGVKRKGSRGLEIREGFMAEAGVVLDMKDSWALDGQRGRKGISRVGSAGAAM